MADENIFTGLNSIKFNQRFREDKDCLIYLSNIKWADGYKCKRCGKDKFSKGKKAQNRRCTKCNYDESPTVGALF
jgi:tRNA(Ile2) C34 agmatinyltransferase TiaS